MPRPARRAYLGPMNTSTLQHLDRPEDTGPATSERTPPTPDDEVRFWALIDLMEDTLTES